MTTIFQNRYLAFFLGLFLFSIGLLQAQEVFTDTEKAFVIPIRGEISPSRMIFVRRGIQKAEDEGAKYIIFDIDTFGGRVDSALQITTLIGSASGITTIAYIPAIPEGTGVSWSAGALISFACDRIYMAPGTSIGAAAPVYQTQTGIEMAPEKTVSAVRAQMAALAEKNGFPKAVAFAMVDEDVELIEVFLDGELLLVSTDDLPDLERVAESGNRKLEKGKTVLRSGKLLTLTAGEMEKYGISSGTISSLEELFDVIGVLGRDTVELEETVADRAAAFVTGAVLTGILTLIGLVAVYMEVTSPGFGVPGTIAIICFAVVFLGSALLGTVGSIELLIFLLGVVALVVEIFLIPGFGITGISGIILIAIALILSRQDFVWPEFEWEWEVFRRNLLVIGISILASILTFGLIIRLFPHFPLFRRLILASPEGSRVVESSSIAPGQVTESGLIGKRGTAVTTLRPVGKADFDGRVLVVQTSGEYLEKGTALEIDLVEGNQIMVSRC